MPGHDVGVPQLPGDLRLPFQLPPGRRIGTEVRPFEGDLAAEPQIAGPPHLAHAAGADRLVEPVTAGDEVTTLHDRAV